MSGEHALGLGQWRSEPVAVGGTSGRVQSTGGPRRALTRLLLGMVRLYQLAHQGRLSGCRFVPTCSAYAMEAIQVHGPWRGGWMAMRRLGRCAPWGGHGVDPVPDRRSG